MKETENFFHHFSEGENFLKFHQRIDAILSGKRRSAKRQFPQDGDQVIRIDRIFNYFIIRCGINLQE